MNKAYTVIAALIPVLLSTSCRRDRSVDPIAPQEIDGRQKFTGIYDVYDTLGNWNYEMEISLHPGLGIDSLRIDNWADNFIVYCQQDAGDQSNLLDFGLYFGIQDSQGKRWALYRESDDSFMANRLVNDTLRMAYSLNNIAFYTADGVPYFSQSYREYAVKRDWE